MNDVDSGMNKFVGYKLTRAVWTVCPWLQIVAGPILSGHQILLLIFLEPNLASCDFSRNQQGFVYRQVSFYSHSKYFDDYVENK